MPSRILFICQHNSTRSQMAEAYLKKMGGQDFCVQSAGFQPAEAVNPLVVEVMKEEGIDLTDQKPQSVFELYLRGELYDYVITVCSDSEDKCPIFPGVVKRRHIPFQDPASVQGTDEEKRERVREIRNQIRQWVAQEIDSLR